MDLSDFGEFGVASRLGLILGAAITAHLAVSIIRSASRRVLEAKLHRRLSKARTVMTLVSSIAVFALYFGAIGFALSELGISVTAYVASASIIGLAVAFGSQGLVQDVVMGLTIIFSDLFDVGDMVGIGGQTGIVRRLGMRFTILVNAFGSEVHIPNRSVTNVINYPRGYIRCLADITLSNDEELANAMELRVQQIVSGFGEQFPGILVTVPDYEGRHSTSASRCFLRVKFRIWPGRGSLIENEFRKEVFDNLKKLDEKYIEWMIAVSYEVERRPRN